MALVQVSTFQQRLKEALCETTLTDFAKKIGLSKQAISNYTTGVSVPKRPVIATIAIALNVNEAWLIGYDVDKERPKYRWGGQGQLIIEDAILAALFNRIITLNDDAIGKVSSYIDDLALSGKYNK